MPVLRPILWPVLLLISASCVSPLKAPSAFAGERYLCDEKSVDEWQARIQDCRAAYQEDGSCLGLISFRGVIDSQTVVVDSPVTRLIITDTPKADATITRDLFMDGLSPYFLFSFDFPNFSDPGHSKSGFAFNDSPACDTPQGVEPCFGGVLNLEVRGGTYFSELSTLLQNIAIDTVDELGATFTADIARGGDISGCFDLNLAPRP